MEVEKPKRKGEVQNYKNLSPYKFGISLGVDPAKVFEVVANMSNEEVEHFDPYEFSKKLGIDDANIVLDRLVKNGAIPQNSDKARIKGEATPTSQPDVYKRFEEFGLTPEQIFDMQSRKIDQESLKIINETQAVETTKEKIAKKSQTTGEINKKNKKQSNIGKRIKALALAALLATTIGIISKLNSKSNETVERLEQEYAMLAEDAGVINFEGEHPITIEDVNLKNISLTENYEDNLENLPDTTDRTVEYIADETLAIAGKNSGLNSDERKSLAIDNLSINNPDCRLGDRTNAIVEYDLVHGEPDTVNKRINDAEKNNSTIQNLLDSSKGRGAR